MSAHTLDRLIKEVHAIDDLGVCPKLECRDWMRRSQWNTANSPPSAITIEYLCTNCLRLYSGSYDIKKGYRINI